MAGIITRESGTRPKDRAHRRDPAARGRSLRQGRCLAVLTRSLLATALVTLALTLGLAQAADPTARAPKDKVKTTAPAMPPAAAKPAAKPAAPAAEPDTDLPPPSAVGGEMAMGTAAMANPANFAECVRVALSQSPLLLKSSIEIESRRLDVGDAYSQFIPTIAINTTYYFSQPPLKDKSAEADRKAYTINFSTGQWNPVLTAFEVQARREMVNIAVLAHLQVIDGGLKRLGTNFLQLGMLNDQLAVNREKEEMAKQYLEFTKTKSTMGQGANLDVRIAETKLSVVKAEADKIVTTRGMLLDDLKFILGVPFIQKINLDLANAKGQVLESFNPADVTDEKLRSHSFDLRMLEYEKALQKKNIALSYVKFLPTFSFGFQTVDALNDNSVDRDAASGFPFYPSVSFSLPLDWWTKSRDVSRQNKKLAQLRSEGRTKEFKLMAEFQKGLAELRSAITDVKYAQAKVDLAKLKSQQTQYRFETGQVEFDAIVNSQEEYHQSRQELILKTLDRDTAMLVLRAISGGLQDRYVNPSIRENL